MTCKAPGVSSGAQRGHNEWLLSFHSLAMVISSTESKHTLPFGERLGAEGAEGCEERWPDTPPFWTRPRAPCRATSGTRSRSRRKLLELCSSVPPGLGEARHMESREQC